MEDSGAVPVRDLSLLERVVRNKRRICHKPQPTSMAAYAVRAAVTKAASAVVARGEAVLANMQRELKLELEPVEALLDQHGLLSLTRGAVMACRSVLMVENDLLTGQGEFSQIVALDRILRTASDGLDVMISQIADEIGRVPAGRATVAGARHLMDDASAALAAIREQLVAADWSGDAPAIASYNALHAVISTEPGHGYEDGD
jgi:hypothetical protein